MSTRYYKHLHTAASEIVEDFRNICNSKGKPREYAKQAYLDLKDRLPVITEETFFMQATGKAKLQYDVGVCISEWIQGKRKLNQARQKSILKKNLANSEE